MLEYQFLSSNERRNDEWNYIELTRTVEIKYNGEARIIALEDLISNIEETLFAVIASINIDIEPEDKIRVAIKNESLAHDIWVSFKKGSQLTRNVIFNAIYKVCQSKLEFLIEGKLIIDIVIIKMPSGGGHKRKYGVSDLASYERLSPKAISIEKDGLCCARAIVVGKAICDKLTGVDWRRLKDDVSGKQTAEAKQLCSEAEVQAYCYCGIEELQKFQNYLLDYRIVVTDARTKKVIFAGEPSSKVIYLIYHDNHYFPTRSMKAFLGYEYYCNHCLQGFRVKTQHRCDFICKKCFSDSNCTPDVAHYCNDCCREFVSLDCYNKHRINFICTKLRFCQQCKRTYRSKKDHVCGKFYCCTCREMVGSKNHLCYISQPSLKRINHEDANTKVFIFYDIESYVTEDGIHKPVLLLAKALCSRCYSVQNDNCNYCENKILERMGENCIEIFCNWLFKDFRANLVSKEKIKINKTPKIYVIAHNGKAYDFHFILNYLNDNQIAGLPNIIKTGSKILSMEYLNVKFLDSVSFLPMPLKALPKAFGFDEQKGWFPHKFNRVENWHYNGIYPDCNYYEPDSMSDCERTNFLIWYETNKNKTFSFKDELINYCRLDVEILAKAFLSFRDSFVAQTGLDPITRCITIAQACMEVYKVSFLLPQTIAVIPSFGYDPKRKSSVIANIWLSYLEKTQKIKIQREKKIGRYFVDGFCEKTKVVYEFYGCFFHGCKFCYPKNRHYVNSKWLDKTMDQLHENTINRARDIESMGYLIVSKWECKFTCERKNNPDLQEFHSLYTKCILRSKLPLDPRDAFFGGRTNAIKLFEKTKDNDRIRYYDFTSLYPFVIKYCAYPIGHPEIIRFRDEENIKQLEQYEGLVFCTVRPPNNLFIPVLPVRIRNKLMFPLCNTCALEANQNNCDHATSERDLTGTWCTPELRKAIEVGYEIIKIYEIWHFKEFSKYDPIKKESGLFSKFIDKWLKLKVEASGWPKNIKTEQEKSDYLRMYEEKEGITLDSCKIQKNASLRTQAKLMANSFWGKFAQRPNLPKVIYLNQPKEFFSLLSDSTKIVLDAYLVNNNTMMVQYENTDAYIDDPKHSNIVIAAFTTTYARLKLYETLEILQDRVLYFDTDSIIYVERVVNEFNLSIGNFLGELTDELEEYGDGSYITKFVSGGPKNYAYEIFTPSTGQKNYCVKIKGITLNYKTKNILSFDAIENLIRESLADGENYELQLEQLVFTSTRENEIKSSNFNKKYRLTYDKRRIDVVNLTTLPFGFIE